MSVLRLILVILLTLTTSCAGTASYIIRESQACPTSNFNSYAICMDNLLAASTQPEAVTLRKDLPALVKLVSEARIGTDDAIAWIQNQIIMWQNREYASFESGMETMAKIAAGAVVVVAVVGTVILLSEVAGNAGDSNVSSKSNNYSMHPPAQGCCSWHDGIARSEHYGYYRCGPRGHYLCEDGWESGCQCK